jgi:hypothetical protein
MISSPDDSTGFAFSLNRILIVIFIFRLLLLLHPVKILLYLLGDSSLAILTILAEMDGGSTRFTFQIRIHFDDPQPVLPQEPEDLLDIDLRTLGDLLGAGAGTAGKEFENVEIIVVLMLDAGGT